MPSVRIKTCGLTTAEAVNAALSHRADFLGFIFYPASPRHLTRENAASLAALAPAHRGKVAVVVDETAQAIADILAVFPADLLQLHGNESVQRVSEIKTAFGLPVIKAFPVCSASDLGHARGYEGIADYFMFDARPQTSCLPGGSGERFDWSLLKGWKTETPWFLSGGLDAENVREALRITQATLLDVSSGIERERGVKDPERIRQFIETARNFRT